MQFALSYTFFNIQFDSFNIDLANTKSWIVKKYHILSEQEAEMDKNGTR